MKTHLNLVPDAYRSRILIRRLMGRWLCVCTATAAAAGGYWLYASTLTRAHQQEVTSLESIARPLRDMQEASLRLRAELTQLEQNDALLRRLQDEGSPITPVALVSQSAQKCGGRVWIQKLALQSHTEKPSTDKKPGEKEAPDPEPTLRIKVEGLAADHLAVAEFVAALRSSNALSHVELKSSVAQSEGASTRHFLLEAEL